MKKIFITLGIILAATGTVVGLNSHNNYKNVDTNATEYGGTSSHGRATDYQSYSLTETIPDKTTLSDEWLRAKTGFNFLSKKNILITYFIGGAYVDTYHVNDISDTNPDNYRNEQYGLEYDYSNVGEGSLNVFTSDDTIYFSCHPNGSVKKYTDLTFPVSSNATITTLILGGGTADLPDQEHVSRTFMDSNKKPYSNSDLGTQAWNTFSTAFGQQELKKEGNSVGDPIENRIYDFFAKCFCNGGLPSDKQIQTHSGIHYRFDMWDFQPAKK